MPSSTLIDIPHKLGRVEAKRRLATGADKMFQHLPGGAAAHLTSSWPSEYQMLLDVKTMGQAASAVVDVEETYVRVSLTLPLMLSFVANKIVETVRKSGERLLLP